MKTFPAFIVAIVCLAPPLAFAHDPRGAIKQELTAASRDVIRALNAVPTAEEATRSVLSNLRLWPVPRKLTVCFVEGSSALRKRVTDVMRRLWPIEELADGRLSYDVKSFDSTPDCSVAPADIQVGFKAGDGHWSYVGIESLQHSPSMNFDGLSEKTEAGEFEGVVGHELGHALGLEHEHQSPAAPRDCGWNFGYLFSAYQWASEEDMVSNFKKLEDYMQDGNHAYIFSAYDKASIMHYSFPPKAFKDGARSPCFIDTNNSPSDQDKTAIRVAYGRSAHSQALARSVIPNMWRDRFSDAAAYAKLQQLMDLKLKLLGQ